jgi:ubiquinone/menaquinone biosynthesis C-methylase UbiE
MDRLDLPLAETWRALADLETVNRRLFGLVGETKRQLLADIGCGSGQVAESLRRAAARRGREIVVIGVDRKLSHLVFARRMGVAHLPVVARVEALPLPDGALDWSLSTLLLHHFDHSGGRRLLAEMVRIARRGAMVVDLRRAWLARVLFRLALPILRVGRVASHDGRVSTETAWSLDEVRQIAAGYSIEELRSRFPYRFSLLVADPER